MHIPKRIVNMLLLMCAPLVCIGFAEKGPCKTLSNGCCPDKQWDTEMNKCVDCPVGFFAVNCSRQCVYPYYGKECNQKCSCDKTHCSFVHGCETGKTNQGVSNASSETYGASKATPTENSTNKLFILLMIATTILVAIGIAYTALPIIERHWNRAQREHNEE